MIYADPPWQYGDSRQTGDHRESTGVSRRNGAPCSIDSMCHIRPLSIASNFFGVAACLRIGTRGAQRRRRTPHDKKAFRQRWIAPSRARAVDAEFGERGGFWRCRFGTARNFCFRLSLTASRTRGFARELVRVLRTAYRRLR